MIGRSDRPIKTHNGTKIKVYKDRHFTEAKHQSNLNHKDGDHRQIRTVEKSCGRGTKTFNRSQQRKRIRTVINPTGEDNMSSRRRSVQNEQRKTTIYDKMGHGNKQGQTKKRQRLEHTSGLENGHRKNPPSIHSV